MTCVQTLTRVAPVPNKQGRTKPPQQKMSKTLHIKTFGCQMNAYDSERMAEALAPLGTDEHKPHLTDAPWVVVLFRHAHGLLPDGRKRTYYYTQESCGIAAGFFIAGIHRRGPVPLTPTPAPKASPGAPPQGSRPKGRPL